MPSTKDLEATNTPVIENPVTTSQIEPLPLNTPTSEIIFVIPIPNDSLSNKQTMLTTPKTTSAQEEVHVQTNTTQSIDSLPQEQSPESTFFQLALSSEVATTNFFRVHGCNP